MIPVVRNKIRFIISIIICIIGLLFTNFSIPPVAQAYTHVAGQDYQICNLQSQYLTSPWTYDALSSGSQTYTVAQYQALSGYGTTLPPLPDYIASESAGTTAAVIFAPGSTDVNSPAYNFPESPILYFFEGGSYGALGLSTISGDEFIGGSAPGFPEPQFDNGGAAGGIDAGNGTYYYSGGSSTLSATASAGTTTINTTTAIPGFISYLTFSDGSTYQITGGGGTSLTIGSPLASDEASGSAVWANQSRPLAEVAAPAIQGDTSITLTSSTIPLVKYGEIVIGDDAYRITSVSGSQSGYTIGVAGLDTNVATNTPIYYSINAGDVTVEYLDINNDQHNTTGTIYTGAGWTIEHNNIHDGYSKGPGWGVALYGGDEGIIEYNCLSKMGDYGENIFGTNNKFDYNEVYESNYEADPGCGCSGGGKWWGTLNADIVDNAFVNESPGDGVAIWLDNGNTGTLISGNYFYLNVGSSVHSETGFNLNVTGNLFLDSGWGNGTGGCSTNCDGSVNINTSGGMNIPGSRYENEISINNNQFINDWMGINVWQAGGRSCENSGEGWPDDAGYCSGGFPVTSSTTNGGQYYFSHQGDTAHGFATTVAQNAASGSSTIEVVGSIATNDQIGFANPVKTTTTDTTAVTTFTGSPTSSISATTTGFPSSGEIRVGTSKAWWDGGGSFTGAILSYTGTTGTSFTGVNFERGSGTLAGTIESVQPYKVTGETCYANDCVLSITPSLSTSETAGTTVTNAGTCQLYATSAALPSGPLSPGGVSYWDGCQWQAKNVSVTTNTFFIQPSLIANSTPLLGGGTTTTCAIANSISDSCGTNFMAYQLNNEAPFDTEIEDNAFMSSSSFTGCPSWDPGCSADPLSDLNALSPPPGAPTGNGEAPFNNVWSNNTYTGPWGWSDVYLYGNCAGGGVVMPSDPGTGHGLTSSDCGLLNYGQWQSIWQQDNSSTYNPLALSLGSIGSDIHGADQSVMAYEDTRNAGGITSHLFLNGTTDSTIATSSSTPVNFHVNTTNYPNGSYTVAVNGIDTGDNAATDSASSVYITNADLNSDNKVNLSDLAIMAAHWGQTDSNYNHGNITGGTTIGNSDLTVMSSNWGWAK